MSCKLLLATAAALTLAACNTIDPVSQSPDPAFGEAVKWNKEAQIIDPDPQYPDDAAQPGDSGAKGAAAVERYRKGTVKEVEAISSTQSQSGGGSGPK